MKLQRSEINQSLYYAAKLVNQQDITATNDDSREEECAESPQATIDQLIEVSGRDNIKEIWGIEVGNSSKIKHYVVLLKNNAHICSCLMAIRKGIICRHYFQVTRIYAFVSLLFRGNNLKTLPSDYAKHLRSQVPHSTYSI